MKKQKLFTKIVIILYIYLKDSENFLIEHVIKICSCRMFRGTVRVYSLVLVIIMEVFTNIFGHESCSGKGTLFQCKVNLPQKNVRSSQQSCAVARYQETLMQQMYYNLTVPKNPEDPNPNQEPLFPRLNQSYVNIALKATFGKDSKWFSNYYGNLQLLNLTRKQLIPIFENKHLSSFSEYHFIYQSFLNTTKRIPSSLFALPFDSSNFTDIVTDEKWKDDKYFVQRRLAGQCAYFLRLVNDSPDKNVGIKPGKLMAVLNEEFDWDSYLEEKFDVTLKEAITSKRLFVLYHEMYSKIPQTPDISDIDSNDDIKLRDSPSPISLFILNEKRELEIAAIQINDSKTASVFTPKHEEYVWLKAKASVEIVEMAICQLIGHLSETHATQEIFCNLFHRHLGRLHPLHQIMVPHCEGTSPVGALGLGSLLDHERYMHKLFNIGHMGSRTLVNEYYKFQNYEDADFLLQMKRQGLENASLIKYHPYRDDGRVIWDEIKYFAWKYVKIYYQNDRDVMFDRELQSFVNEISADGNSTNGGKYKGFPAKFLKRSDLTKFITRFIWLVVKHAANSYPLIPYGAYVPLAPTKLYDNPEGELKKDYAYHLPNGKLVLSEEVLIFTLATFRLNKLFDYSKVLDDSKARCLVKKTFIRLNTCIQKKLEKRNSLRFKKNDLTYQFMEPRWLPNSIHS